MKSRKGDDYFFGIHRMQYVRGIHVSYTCFVSKVLLTRGKSSHCQANSTAIRFNSLGQLIGTGSIALAGDIGQTLDDLLGILADDHLGKPLKVAFAAANKVALGNNTVFDFQLDLLGAGAFCFIDEHIL